MPMDGNNMQMDGNSGKSAILLMKKCDFLGKLDFFGKRDKFGETLIV